MKIEINLQKLERGKRKEKVKVVRDGKVTYEYRRVGRKEEEKVEKPEEIIKSSMTVENLSSMKTGLEVGLPMSTHECDIHLCKFKDDRKAIYKVTELSDRVGERGYHNLAKSVGWDVVPETTVVDLGKGDGSCQQWISDTTQPKISLDDKGTSITKEHFDDLAKIFIMDTITGNNDRHQENILIDKDNKCWAIDNDTWSENVIDFDPKAIEKAFNKLIYSTGDVSGDVGYNRMCQWLSQSLTPDDFKVFKSIVDDKVVEIMKYKDKMASHYKDKKLEIYRGDTIGNNVKYLEKYLEQIK